MASERGLRAHIALDRRDEASRFSLDVVLDFEPGMNVLFGPSGAGKTTILSSIAGLLRPSVGEITLAGRALFESARALDVPPNERRVALVFQTLALFPHLDALANVAYGVPRSLRGAERLQAARGFLERMRVPHLARRFPSTLSGGEAQRVALARALASEPQALLLDEPFSALDDDLARELGRELAEYVRTLALPVVLVTHDRALARSLGDDARVTLLRAGNVEATGSVADLLRERA